MIVHPLENAHFQPGAAVYTSFYGLTAKPFSIVSNPDCLYLSPKHRAALTYLEYGLKETAGFILLTGDIGTGKTTLIRFILKQTKQNFETAVIFNTNITSAELLNLILRELGLEAAAGDKVQALEKIYRHLAARYREGRKVLLVIDEAQNLTDEVLEEIRMLSNFQGDERILLQIMLVGQPELKRRLNTPSLSQLKQRIGVHFHLGPLSREETGMYVRFRLEHAGGRPGLFTTRAVAAIFEATGGIPRSINLLCDAALVYGFADELNPIDLPVIERVLADRSVSGGSPEALSVDNPVQPAIAATVPVSGNGRMEKLEAELRELRRDLSDRLALLEKDHTSVGDIIERLERLLADERRKNQEWQDRCSVLEQRISLLRVYNRKMRSRITDSPQANEK